MAKTTKLCFRSVLAIIGVMMLLTSAPKNVKADETPRFQVQLLNASVSEAKAVTKAETMWTTALQDPQMFKGTTATPNVTTITISFDDANNITGNSKTQQVADDVLGETADMQGVKQIVIHTKGIQEDYDLTSYATENSFLTSVLAHEIGHAMGLQHNLQDKNDLMYPVNLGPIQAISEWDASHLPWQVDTGAIQQLATKKSWLSQGMMVQRTSMFEARVAHLPTVFWTMVIGLAVASLLVVVRVVVWHRQVVKQMQQMATAAEVKE